ncbi:MAG: 4Fe-4S dicluster domain-containing protein [Anaerolineales bacterium]|nr:4Fe-4S dicluster domain-containing protein [Anaerolineales bacterium]
MEIVVYLFLAASLLLPGWFSIVSWKEGERRAAVVSAALGVVSLVVFNLFTLLPAIIQQVFLTLLVSGGVVLIFLFMLPSKGPGRLRDQSRERFDERDIIFSRSRLQPGTARYREYYNSHPRLEQLDNRWRERPGLLSPQARYGDPLLFKAPEAAFTLIDSMGCLAEGSPAVNKTVLPDRADLTAYMMGLSRFLGAHTVGVTRLRPEHVYSHIGRGSGRYGAPLAVEHRYALALTVEMDYDMLGSSPRAPAIMESAHQYVEAGRIAVQIALIIRSMGYPARAHIDGNYRVICPLVARDAGLGEIGRMGLLITPDLGPRVRLAVVTTDLELAPGAAPPDGSVIDFCRHCVKCAENCPARAIPTGDRIEINGAMRWQIDSDACFRYWNTVGTDCGRCMSVCPYSHPDTVIHKAVRWGNHRSAAFRRLALRLDDLFYGKSPQVRRIPKWLEKVQTNDGG